MSWQCPSYQDMIVDFVERHNTSGAKISRGKIDDWLSEMIDHTKSDQENRSIASTALKVLDIALSRYHYTHEKCIEYAKELWKKILSLPGVDHNAQLVRLFPLENEAKSGHVSLYTMRVANKLSDNICREHFSKLEKDKGMKNVKWIVLVDDFVSSGETALLKLHEFRNLAKTFKKNTTDTKGYGGVDLLEGKKIALACFVGFFNRDEWKQNKLNSNLKEYDEVLIIDELSNQNDIVESYITDPEEINNLNKLYELSDRRKLFYRKFKFFPKGYKDRGALVSFYYNTPNNSLPILWSSANKWKPPLPRHQATSWRSLKPPNPSKIILANETKQNNLTDLLEQHHKVIILGESGFGKTDLALRVAENIQKKKCQTVVWHDFAPFCSAKSFFCHISLNKTRCNGVD